MILESAGIPLQSGRQALRVENRRAQTGDNAAIFGFDLPSTVALIVLSLILSLGVVVLLNFRVLPSLKKFSFQLGLLPRLFTYGGWVMVSSVVGPVLMYLDRLLIASLVSMAALAYYMPVHEAGTRLLIIAVSLTMTLFPAFSSLEATGKLDRLEILFARSVKYILLILGPVALTLVMFAKELLDFWLGSDFATQGYLALQILAVGVLVCSTAQVPYALLQGIGRPDITAKLHLLELPCYVAVAWVLVGRWGIEGAAAAWTLRVVVDALLLFLISFKVCRFSLRLFFTNGFTQCLTALFLLTALCYGVKKLDWALAITVQILLFVALYGGFVWFALSRVLDHFDRGAIIKGIKLWECPEIK